MVNFIDKNGQFDQTTMVPGDRVKIYSPQNIYVFEMTGSRELVLDLDASMVPQALLDRLLANRRMQELHYGDIEMEEMKIYLYMKWPYLSRRGTCLMYPKVPRAAMSPSIGEGDLFISDEVTDIQPDLPYKQPDAVA